MLRRYYLRFLISWLLLDIAMAREAISSRRLTLIHDQNKLVEYQTELMMLEVSD